MTTIYPWVHAWPWFMVTLLSWGCLGSSTELCASSRICPVGQTCVPGHDRCAEPELVNACVGRSDGEECTNGLDGVCVEAVCIVGCGNHEIDNKPEVTVDEACDGGTLPEGNFCVNYGFDMGAARCSLGCDRVRIDDCVSFDWRTVDVPRTWHIARMWGTAADNIYAVGMVSSGEWSDILPFTCPECGSVFHYNGKSWRALDIKVDASLLTDVWGSGPDDVYVVGVSGTVLHYNGQEWRSPVAATGEPFTDEHLMAIWGSAWDDVYIVGDNYVVFHYDGAGWSQMNTGLELGEENDLIHYALMDIWGGRANDVFAVGKRGSIIHYNGNDDRTWIRIRQEPEVTTNYNSVWGIGQEALYVAGEQGEVLEYLRGERTWNTTSLGDSTDLSGVWGDSRDEVYAVTLDGRIWEYNGSDWSRMRFETKNRLVGIWGSSGEDVLAVGVNGTILHHSDRGWVSQASGIISEVHGMWHGNADDVVIVGAGPLEGVILHYDTSNGHIHEGIASTPVLLLFDVWGSSSDNIFAVGSWGAILHYDGNPERMWHVMDAVTGSHLRSVWGSGANSVYAVGDSGTVLHYTGDKWQRLDTMDGISESITGVWGAGPEDVFIVGHNALIMHYDGVQWKRMSSDLVIPTIDLHGIWGTSHDNVFAVGEFGTIVHYDGEQWSFQKSVTDEALYAIWGSSAKDIYAAGVDGMVLHYDGAQWSPVTSGATRSLAAITGIDDPRMRIFAGAGGELHKLKLPK